MSEQEAEEKLSMAVNRLAASAAPIQERLTTAALVGLVDIDTDHLEGRDKRVLFESIKDRLGAADRVEDSTGAMSDEEAEAVARDIVELHWQLRREP
jgi:hypothetical protein